MKTKSFTVFSILLAGILFIAGAQLTASAQGRGRGGGGGNPGRGGGPPGGSPGVDRGRGNAGQRSGGRSDDGLGNASDKSRGRSDNGIERARSGRNNGDAPNTDKDLNRFRGIANKLGTTPDALRAEYQAALAANPNLKFGQFVAANVVARNLSATHPNITSDAILAGLQSGKSLGQTLQDLGLSSSDAKQAEKEAKREIKHQGK